MGMKKVFKQQDLQKFDLKLNKYVNFPPLEIVDRGSETQFQVGDLFQKDKYKRRNIHIHLYLEIASAIPASTYKTLYQHWINGRGQTSPVKLMV